MWIDDEVLTGFQIKKTALLKRWIRGESKQQIAHLVLELHLRRWSRCWFVFCVPAHRNQRNVGSGPSQVAVNNRWKANGWLCSVISAFRLPLDSWNVCDDKRRLRHLHSAKQAYLIHTTRTIRTHCNINQAHSNLVFPRCKYSQLNSFILLEPAAHILYLLPQNPEFRKPKGGKEVWFKATLVRPDLQKDPQLLINQKMQLLASNFKCLRLIGIGMNWY